jgi:hypothetical protein
MYVQKWDWYTITSESKKASQNNEYHHLINLIYFPLDLRYIKTIIPAILS